MARAQKKRRGAKKVTVSDAELPQRTNYIIMIAGVGWLFASLIVMAMGDAVSPLSVTIAPIMLFIGFFVIIPIGIIYRKRHSSGESQQA